MAENGLIREPAPAKINLYLEVGPLAADGYHPVTTILQTLALHDLVTLDPDAPFSFECDPSVGVPSEENIACRAAHELARHAGRTLEGAFHVEKAIPTGAGLGGGSSDAAAVLRVLCDDWGYDPLDPEVVAVAASLGADVPFFLRGGTGLYGGRGDELVQALPTVPLDVVIVNPGEPVPTAAAYTAFDRLVVPPAPGPQPMIDALVSGDPDLVAAALHNDMTEASCALVPAVAQAIRLVQGSSGVIGTAMAGSGSSVFGICETVDSAMETAELASAMGSWTVATRAIGVYGTDWESV